MARALLAPAIPASSENGWPSRDLPRLERRVVEHGLVEIENHRRRQRGRIGGLLDRSGPSGVAQGCIELQCRQAIGLLRGRPIFGRRLHPQNGIQVLVGRGAEARRRRPPTPAAPAERSCGSRRPSTRSAQHRSGTTRDLTLHPRACSRTSSGVPIPDTSIGRPFYAVQVSSVTPDAMLRLILTSRVYDVAQETPLEPAAAAVGAAGQHACSSSARICSRSSASSCAARTTASRI